MIKVDATLAMYHAAARAIQLSIVEGTDDWLQVPPVSLPLVLIRLRNFQFDQMPHLGPIDAERMHGKAKNAREKWLKHLQLV